MALMVGETCLGQGREGAARVVAVQSSLRVDKLLFTTLLLIFTTLLIGFGFYIETLRWMVVFQESCSWACSLQVPDRLHCLRSLATTSFHHRFCSPAAGLPPAGAHTRSCLDSRSSGFLERCPRKRR